MGNEHVPEIEHKNCIIKERKRALIINVLFKKTLGRIIIDLIRFVWICINQKPSNNGVPDVYYPYNIIMVQDIAYEKHCKLRFGSFVESHGDFKITNNM